MKILAARLKMKCIDLLIRNKLSSVLRMTKLPVPPRSHCAWPDLSSKILFQMEIRKKKCGKLWFTDNMLPVKGDYFTSTLKKQVICSARYSPSCTKTDAMMMSASSPSDFMWSSLVLHRDRSRRTKFSSGPLQLWWGVSPLSVHTTSSSFGAQTFTALDYG